MIFTEEVYEKDCKSGESDTSWTMRLIIEEGTRLVRGIKLTYDLPELHPEGKCPVLDLELWAEGVKHP